MTQLTKLLGLEITDSALEKWEKSQNHPTAEHQAIIVNFLELEIGQDAFEP
jgi:hypothetical protein